MDTLTPTPKNSTLLPIVAGVAFVAGLVGFGIGIAITSDSLSDTVTTVDESSKKDAYAAGYEAARQKLVERGLSSNASAIADEMLAEAKQFGGRFENLSGNTLTVRVSTIDPLTEDTVRTVVLTADTKIVLMELKDAETISKEMDVYGKTKQDATPVTDPSNATASTLSNPPTPYNEVSADRSALTTGVMLDVSTAEPLTSSTLTATYIRVTPAPAQLDLPEIPPPSQEVDLGPDNADDSEPPDEDTLEGSALNAANNAANR